MAVPPLRVPEGVHALAQAVLAAGGTAYVAGGAIRDQSLGRPVQDWDIEVYGLDESRLEALIARHGQVKKVGGRFGVYVLQGMEIALPQGPGFQVGADISSREACRRRDFTVNAMLWNPLTGDILDYFQGMAHLREKVLSHVDTATFAEDPLRVLRAARLAGQLGFAMAPDTARLCRALAPRLHEVPWERVQKELLAWLLRGQDLQWTWDALVPTGAQTLFPELRALQGVPQRPDAHPEGDVWIHTGRVLAAAATLRTGQRKHDLILMLGALLHDLGKVDSTFRDERGRWRALGHEEISVAKAEQFMERWFPSSALQRQVLPLLRWHGAVHALARDGAKAGAYRRLGLKVPDPALLLDLARADGMGAGGRDEQALERARRIWEEMGILGARPPAWLSGHDLSALGLSPGPAFGRLLDLAYRMQLSGRFADRGALHRRFAALLQRLDRTKTGMAPRP